MNRDDQPKPGVPSEEGPRDVMLDLEGTAATAPSFAAKLLHGLVVPMIPLLAVFAALYQFPPQGGQGCGWLLLGVSVLPFSVLPAWVLIAAFLLAFPWRSLVWVRILFLPLPILLTIALVALWPVCAVERVENVPPPPPAEPTIP
jgi:hypothetical protein